ncbi:ThuA domain-containing protein [Planctomycetota bacterium]
MTGKNMNYDQKRNSFLKEITTVFVLLMFLTLAVQGTNAAPIPAENDRIGWSADGNRHDPDDWGATAMALAIFAKQGWQNKLVHFDYNNWLPDNTPFKSTEETISVVEGAKNFKFTQTKIYDCQTDLEAAVDNVVAEINKSTKRSRFWYVQAGPFEVAYLALMKADPSKRKYCILVSHSTANDRPEHWPGQHGKDDCVALGAEFYYTTGQGKDKFGGGKFHEWQLVDWMKDSPCPEYRWVYSRFKKTAEHKHGVLDASDGGMAFVLATGDTDGNFDPKLRDFLGADWKAAQKVVRRLDKVQTNDPKRRQAIDKFNQIHEVDRDVVAEFNRIKENIKPSVSPTKRRKLLVYAISHGPHRFAIPTGNAILEMLGEETGAYSTVVSDDLAHFEPEALRQFDAVCFANTTGEVFYRPIDRQQFQELSAEEKERQIANAERLVKNLTDYVRNGGGFFGIHAATDTLKKSPAYGDMIGGYFDGHPWSGSQTVSVRIEQPQHPLCVDVFHGKGFSIKDEIYQMKDPYSRDKVQVLLSVDVEQSEKPGKPIKRKDRDFPLSWIKEYGKGRVFYSALGHNKAIFGNPLLLQHWLEGLQYVMGDKPID